MESHVRSLAYAIGTLGRVDVERILRARQDELADELARLTAAPEPGTNLSFGKRIGEGTTQAVERISSTATARSIAASLADVDRALEKLAEDSYGSCDNCGLPISAERLEAIPWAALCMSCASRRTG
jgi:DnaK suppressor protein